MAGRDRLRHLEPLRSITQLAALLANELEASVSPDTPLLLAGHSMGAQVAFETCRLLEQRGLAPQGLIISGCHARICILNASSAIAMMPTLSLS